MTQPLCQVRILMPENNRFEPLCTLLDQAEPELLRTACHVDGQGFDPAEGKKEDRRGGPGLLMMNDRASRLGSTPTVQPGPGGTGTLVACGFDPALGWDRSVRTA